MASHEASYPTHSRNWAVLILGGVCILLGLVLLAGGVWLVIYGGSFYYALAGLGLGLTGYFLIRQQMAAVWIYLFTWVGTVIWAFWEVGTDWWAQVPRLVAPTLILILVLACIPALRPRH